jgi:hypothetical protein
MAGTETGGVKVQGNLRLPDDRAEKVARMLSAAIRRSKPPAPSPQPESDRIDGQA